MPAVGMDRRGTGVWYWGMDCLHVAANLGPCPEMEMEYAAGAGIPTNVERGMPGEVVEAAAAAAAPVDGERPDPRIPSF